MQQPVLILDSTIRLIVPTWIKEERRTVLFHNPAPLPGFVK